MKLINSTTYFLKITYIVAQYSGTVVYAYWEDGTVVISTTLNTASDVRYNLVSPHFLYVKLSKPGLVGQFATGCGVVNPSYLGDPSMVIVHPLNYFQYLASYYGFKAPSSNSVSNLNYVEHFLNIVARSQDVTGIKLNGAAISGWVSIWNSNYSAVSVQVYSGTVYKINQVNNKTFYAILYGHLFAESYAHALCGSSPLFPASVACGWPPLPPTTTSAPSSSQSTTIQQSTTVLSSTLSTITANVPSAGPLTTLAPSSTQSTTEQASSTVSLMAVTTSTAPIGSIASASSVAASSASLTTLTDTLTIPTTFEALQEMSTTLSPVSILSTVDINEPTSTDFSSQTVSKDVTTTTPYQSEQFSTTNSYKCECPTSAVRMTDCSEGKVADVSNNPIISEAVNALTTGSSHVSTLNSNKAYSSNSTLEDLFSSALFSATFFTANNFITDTSTTNRVPTVNGKSLLKHKLQFEPIMNSEF